MSSGTNAKKAKMSGQGGWRQGGAGGGGRGRGGGGGYGRGRGGGGGYRGQGSGGGGGHRGPRDKLAIGMRGFICSCNFNERDCTKEAYNLLNEYFREDEDQIKSEPTAEGNPEATEAAEALPAEKDDEEDIEKALQAEVKQLKSNENRFKFKAVDSEVPNIVFISTMVEDPAKLAHRILEDLHAKKEQKSKFLLRMLPIDCICKAYMDDLENHFREIVSQHFPAGEYISFQILFKSRYNGNIHRDEVIKLLADIVVEVNSLSVVDLTNPKCTIIVEVIKNKICLGFLKDFALYKKYNLVEVATPAVPKQDSATAAPADQAPPAATISEAAADEPTPS